MDEPIDWAMLESHFAAAIALPPEQRPAYLDQACRDDPSLRRRLEHLLAEDSRGGVLDAPAIAAGSAPGASGAAAPSLVGRTIGRYRVVRVIASGGMGTVYEAEQEHPRRIVALKVMHAGLVSHQALRRFERESDILGRLHHPAIAQVYETGVFESESGPQPFFAMEFVDGLPITEYVTRHDLDAPDRLALIQRVCDGVEYAHSRGVIHRDLKPANVLVDSSGQPRILDFGIARVAGADAPAQTLRTDAGQLMGTVPYMSPEQVAGDPEDIDHRCDVYALGVIAFELLTGRLPHPVRGRGLGETMHAIRHEDATPLDSIDRAFRGDLSTIVAKALEKDKARRYASAADLASDLDRFLRDEPVRARPPSTLYQIRKFAQRNRALVTGVAAAFILLVAGVTGTTWQWARATHQRDQADEARLAAVRAEADAKTRLEQVRDLASELTGLADSDLADLVGATLARERLAREGLSRLLDMVPASGEFDDVSLASDLSYAYQRLGDVELVRGRTAAAESNYEQALRIRARLADLAPDSGVLRRALAVGHWKVGEACARLGRLDDAARHNETSFNLLQSESVAELPGYSHYIAAAHRRIAESDAAQGRDASALERFQESLRWFDLATSELPTNPPTHRGRAMALRGYAERLAAAGSTDEALAALQESLHVIDRQEQASGPSSVWNRVLRAESLLAKAMVHVMREDHEPAFTCAREAVRLAEALAEADPANLDSRYLLARALLVQAESRGADRDSAGADDRRRAARVLEDLALADPEHAPVRRDLESIRAARP